MNREDKIKYLQAIKERRIKPLRIPKQGIYYGRGERFPIDVSTLERCVIVAGNACNYYATLPIDEDLQAYQRYECNGVSMHWQQLAAIPGVQFIYDGTLLTAIEVVQVDADHATKIHLALNLQP